ncbi:MAG: D-alanyl-D-alanine carboxypeptidase, partial [Pseudonocardiaceae bacterium]
MSGLGRRVRSVLRLPAQRGKRIVVLVAVLLFVASAGGALGTAALGRSELVVVATMPPPAPLLPTPVLRPADGYGPAPTDAGVGAVLDPLVAHGGLGTLSGQVVDPVTGLVLWQRDAATPLVPGSTAKLLTASAALLALDHHATLRTRVLAGAEPGTVVLVGGGDPTLSATAKTVYLGAARLEALVTQVRAAAVGPVRRVLVDLGRYSGDVLAPGWTSGDVAEGFVAPISAVMLDGGRADPALA